MNINAPPPPHEPRIHTQHGRTFHRGTFQIPMINNSLPTANQVGKTAEFSLQWYRVLYKNYHFILAILSIRHRLRSSLEGHNVSCSQCYGPSSSDKKPRYEAGYSSASTGGEMFRKERNGASTTTQASSGVVFY